MHDVLLGLFNHSTRNCSLVEWLKRKPAGQEFESCRGTI